MREGVFPDVSIAGKGVPESITFAHMKRKKSVPAAPAAAIRVDPKNHRKHNPRNKELIRKSLGELGAGRSILIDGEDHIIAGNGVYEQAEALGIPVRIIETNGTELVAIKRTDLANGDPRRKQLAIADNATSDTSEWDAEADWDDVDLDSWDIELPQMGTEPENKEKEVDENIETDHECPKCGYKW